MLSLSILRGPLDESLSVAILQGYTELAGATVSSHNFRRWTQQSPAGPALHAILKTDDGRLAGHCCLFPIPMAVGRTRFIVGKAEYFFVRSEFRKQAVHGHEKSMKPAAVLLLEYLYSSGSELGWDWYLVSAPPDVAPIHRMAGCRKVVVSLTECLLTFRPWMAAVNTPNIGASQRAALGMAGALQRIVWAVPRKSNGGVREIAVDAPSANGERPQRISLTSEADFLSWRYATSEFRRLQPEDSRKLGLIAKKGSSREYLRVCQSSLDADKKNTRLLLNTLVEIALREKSLGVRWAVYDDGISEYQVVPMLRKMRFLCMRRERTIYVRDATPSESGSAAWQLEDSLFCFDS